VRLNSEKTLFFLEIAVGRMWVIDLKKLKNREGNRKEQRFEAGKGQRLAVSETLDKSVIRVVMMVMRFLSLNALVNLFTMD